VLIMPMP